MPLDRCVNIVTAMINGHIGHGVLRLESQTAGCVVEDQSLGFVARSSCPSACWYHMGNRTLTFRLLSLHRLETISPFPVFHRRRLRPSRPLPSQPHMFPWAALWLCSASLMSRVSGAHILTFQLQTLQTRSSAWSKPQSSSHCSSSASASSIFRHLPNWMSSHHRGPEFLSTSPSPSPTVTVISTSPVPHPPTTPSGRSGNPPRRLSSLSCSWLPSSTQRLLSGFLQSKVPPLHFHPVQPQCRHSFRLCNTCTRHSSFLQSPLHQRALCGPPPFPIWKRSGGGLPTDENGTVNPFLCRSFLWGQFNCRRLWGR